MSKILNNKYVSSDLGLTVSAQNFPTVTIEEILPILKEVAQFGVYEDPEDAYCVFCELGRFGDSSQGEGNHDDNCISLRAQNILKNLGI